MNKILDPKRCHYMTKNGTQCKRRATPYCGLHSQYEYLAPHSNPNYTPRPINEKCFLEKPSLPFSLLNRDKGILEVLEKKGLSLEEYIKILLETQEPKPYIINGIEHIYILLATQYDYTLCPEDEALLIRLKGRLEVFEKFEGMSRAREIGNLREGALEFLYGKDEESYPQAMEYYYFLNEKGYLTEKEELLRKKLEDILNLN